MLIFLWFYVVVAAAFPNGPVVMAKHAEAVQTHMRGMIEVVQPRSGIAIGAASGFVR